MPDELDELVDTAIYKEIASQRLEIFYDDLFYSED